MSRLFTIVILTAGTVHYAAAQGTHWVATWASAQQQPRAAGLGRGGPGAAAPAGPRVAPPPSAFNNQTVRMIARTSLGGSRLRVHLSNAFGAAPLGVGAAHVALRGTDSSIIPG